MNKQINQWMSEWMNETFTKMYATFDNLEVSIMRDNRNSIENMKRKE